MQGPCPVQRALGPATQAVEGEPDTAAGSAGRSSLLLEAGQGAYMAAGGRTWTCASRAGRSTRRPVPRAAPVGWIAATAPRQAPSSIELGAWRPSCPPTASAQPAPTQRPPAPRSRPLRRRRIKSGSGPRKATAASVAELHCLVDGLDTSTLIRVRDRAVIVLGFAGDAAA